jgi:hypothetical protein
MIHGSIRRAVYLLLGASLLLPVYAQTTGVITGTITDSTSSIMPDVKVIVRNTGTGEERVVQSNTSGFYVANSLPVGTYEVEATAAGFKKTSRANIALDVADRLAINLTMAVGEVTESVAVTGEAPVLETEKGDVGYAIGTQQLTDLSVNGRTFTQLMQLIPGSSRTLGDEGGVGFNSSRGFAVNGQRPKYSGVSLDGVENTDMGSQSTMLTSPGLETISELKVQSANYSAEYGTAGGTNIIVATRSGTKEFHGAAYEFLRNDTMDAKNFFATTKPALRYNNFGYRLGGPVIIPHLYNRNRDKTFFFWGEEWRRKRTGSIIRAATPTDAMRAGDFSAEAARIGQPILNPDTKAPFSGNVIPPSLLNQNAQLLLKSLFPSPNVPGSAFLNYQVNGPTPENWREETVNVTHQLTKGTQLMVRYIKDSWVSQYPTTLWGGQAFPTISSIANIPGLSFVAKATSVISPSLLNEVSFAYGSNYPAKGTNGVELTGNYLEPQGLNIPRLFPRIPGRPNKVPNLSFSGGWGNIDSSYYPWWAHHNIMTFTDNVSKTVGSHSLKFGGTFQYSKTPVESQVNPADQGGFSFNGSFTNDPMADFLLGRAASYSELNKLLSPSYNYPQIELYAQDTWKVSKRLTLNLGVRWFGIPHVHEASDLISNFRIDKFDPKQAVTVLTDGTIVPNSGNPLNGVLTVKDGLPRNLVQDHWMNFGPRIGFAWDPTGAAKWSVRGGYGVGYYRVEGNDIYNMVGNPPGAQVVQVFNPLLDNPAGGAAGALRPIGLNALDPVYKIPYIQTFSFEIQHEITPGNALSVGYVGTRGTHLDRARNINQPMPVTGFDFDPRLNTRAIPTVLVSPFLGYTGITFRENSASSTYNSLQVSFKRRMTKGLLMEVAYTYSKTIADASDFGETPQNSYNARADRGPTTFDRPQMLIVNYIYQLPIFRDKTALSGKILGGWQISGITTYQAGTPVNLGLTGGTIGLASRPDVVGSLTYPKTVAQWFSPGIFAAPAFGFFGNAGRDLIRGPAMEEWDAALFKTFHLNEKVGFTLRGEAFNLFNHTNFSGVSSTFGSGNFGQLTSARISRLMEVSAKIEF